ncbi:MAG: beta-glucosidase [Oleiphilaceae bacterium]|jgi:beta-glucosidase
MSELYKDKNIATDKRVSDLLERMTVEEKIGQLGQVCMTGYAQKKAHYLAGVKAGRWGSRILADTEWAGNNAEAVINVQELNEIQRVAVKESRLGIPIIYARDVIYGQSTVLPIPLAQAASWHPQLIEEAYTCIAREATSLGIHWTFSPMMDITRDPRWGRVIESSGEDPYLAIRCSEAVIKGFQGSDPAQPERMLACAKHFCGYGFSEGGRDYDTTEISENTLHNIILPPFKAAVNVGVATVMSSFNDMSGTPVSGDKSLLQGWLKEQQGFDGLVVSDWGSIADLDSFGVADGQIGAAERGFNAGVDMAMTSEIYEENIPLLVEQGRVSEARLNDAVGRILKAKFRAGLFDNPYADPHASAEVLLHKDHRETARKLAEESIVLLKNRDGILPLAKHGIKLAVVGPYSDAQRQHLGSWCVDGHGKDVVTLLTGIKNCAPQLDIVTTQPQFTDEMVYAARLADVVVVCVGESHVRNGEACNIANLELPPGQEELIAAIGRTGTAMVVVQCTGRPVPSPAAEQYAQALVYGWQGGTEIGDAMGRILFGDVSPSGKLPISIPRSTGQIPIYYNRKPKGKAIGIRTYNAYQDEEETPLYPFGFGLSYSAFEYSNIRVSQAEILANQSVTISVKITNTGDVCASEIAQCYIRDVIASTTRPVRELKGFERVSLRAGESTEVCFKLGPDELAFYGAERCFKVELGEFAVYVGADSNASLTTSFTII